MARPEKAFQAVSLFAREFGGAALETTTLALLELMLGGKALNRKKQLPPGQTSHHHLTASFTPQQLACLSPCSITTISNIRPLLSFHPAS
jgi:hypothetical protein